MDGRSFGLTFVIIGLAITAIGLLAWAGLLSWFGRLPGDIRYESGGTRIYVPITTMILVSLVLTALSYLFRRFL